MAVIKCKMCGGDLHITEGATVCECEYCGSRQTVPTADNEKKMTLFTRANRLLRNCEFDKASGVFETIVAEFPEEAEAYWGLVLCKYGIEYVDDPATGKKVPTCHRSSFDNVLDDSNFEQACENADAVARRVYRDEARAIEELRKGIIEVSGKEEPYDIFISYKETDENGERTLDSVIAQDIYNELTEKGYRVFFSRISLESKLGTEYEPYIFAALNSAKVMIVVGTDYENFDAVWVKNEWSRFLKLITSGQKKTLIPVFKNMDAYDMPKEFAKLSAQDMGKVGAMQDLLRGLDKLIGKKNAQNTEEAAAPLSDSGISALNAQTSAMMKRGYMMLSDGDYQKADDFFERVLNNDAECGQAYWGKTLAQAQVPNAEEFGASFLFNRMKGQADIKTVVLPTESISALARKADRDSILKDFSDKELSELLTDLDNTPVRYQTALPFYQQKVKQYSEPSTLHKLAANPDYDRASKYADDTVREAERTVLSSFRAWLEAEIKEEEKKEEAAKHEAEERKNRIIAAIKKRLDEAPVAFQRHQGRIEAEQREAEKKAEEEFQTALAEYEHEYSQAIAAQEIEYKHEVEHWEHRKADYIQKYDFAIKQAEQLRMQIAQQEAEKNNLSGFLSGRKRKALEESITLLNKKLDEIEFPKDPGNKPEKPPALKKDRVPRREDFIPEEVSTKTVDLNEFIKCSLSPTYKTVWEAVVDIKESKAGDEILFGSYYFQNKKKEPLVWKVLAKENNKLFVISKYGLDCQKYHGSYTDITWEKCDLRKWLNETFLRNAFSTNEQKAVLVTKVDNSNSQGNSIWNTRGGNNTEDKVFLLSYTEAGRYFSSNCKPTSYAKERGTRTDTSGNCSWWLRSPGSAQNNAAFVGVEGALGHSNHVDFILNAVRPAMWINLAGI